MQIKSEKKIQSSGLSAATCRLKPCQFNRACGCKSSAGFVPVAYLIAFEQSLFQARTSSREPQKLFDHSAIIVLKWRAITLSMRQPQILHLFLGFYCLTKVALLFRTNHPFKLTGPHAEWWIFALSSMKTLHSGEVRGLHTVSSAYKTARQVIHENS